jgi:methionyl-tRNA synthetase
MLMSAGYELPKQILTTGHFTVDWQKISKSLWNAIDPVEFSEKYSKDMLTLYLLSSFNIWQDWDFDQKQAVLTYNAKLANTLGNLVNRVVVLALKLIENSWVLKETEKELCVETDIILKNIEIYKLKDSIDESFKALNDLNKYTDEKQPWSLIKENEEETRKVLYTISEWLRQVWLCLYAFFPEKMWEMFNKLGLENYVEDLESWKLQELRNKTETFNIKEKGEPLFLRFDV